MFEIQGTLARLLAQYLSAAEMVGYSSDEFGLHPPRLSSVRLNELVSFLRLIFDLFLNPAYQMILND